MPVMKKHDMLGRDHTLKVVEWLVIIDNARFQGHA